MAQEVTQISIPNLPVDVKERLEREAKRQDRSLASLLRTILVDHAEKLDSPAPEPTAA